MRIGEFDESLGREFDARRAAMASELPRLSARLAEPGHGATAPAVPLMDSVRISPEARAAGSLNVGAFPLGPFPAPSELVAALAQLQSSPGAETATVAQRLATLVGRLFLALGGNAVGGVPSAPLPAAAELVREVLALAGQPASPAAPDRIASLARELLALPGPSGFSSSYPGDVPTRFERAAAAILVALSGAAAASESPHAPGAEPGTMPPALLAFLASPRPARPARRKRLRVPGPAQRDSNRHGADVPGEEPTLPEPPSATGRDPV